MMLYRMGDFSSCIFGAIRNDALVVEEKKAVAVNKVRYLNIFYMSSALCDM